MAGWGYAVVGLSALLVAGCSPSVEPAPVAAEAATSTSTPTTTTRVPRATDNSGRPPVTFDPCLDIPDDVLIGFGFDAADKDELAYPMGTHTFLGCLYVSNAPLDSPRRHYLTILSANVTLEEELEKDGQYATPTEVNGRPGVIEINEAFEGECTYVLSTDFGTVHYLYSTTTYSKKPLPVDEWCIGVDEFIATLEPFLEP